MRKFGRKVFIGVFVFLLVFSFYGQGGSGEMHNDTRKSIIAGSWYPGNPDVLKSDIANFLANVPTDSLDGTVIAIIAPHAGYVYSGQTAAYAYKLIAGKQFDSVIVIGPSHREHFRGASVYNTGGYETPLGIVPVNTSLANDIISESDRISFVPSAHSQEHSVEIQLPFLQVVLGEFDFVPVVMGGRDIDDTCRLLSDAIVKVIKDKKVLIVASSDLSHYHGYDQAVSMDAIALRDIETMDWKGLLAHVNSGECEACGGGPIATTMMIAEKRGAQRAKVLHYANSGDVTGDKRGVVGYGAAVFYEKAPSGNSGNERDAGIEIGFSEKDKKNLLALARSSIEYRLAGKNVPDFTVDSAILEEQRGAFVTLKKHGQLRGCIGSFEARGALHRTVEEMAQSAALNDPRFPPVTEEELGDLTIEISVLTPLKKIGSIDEIEIGKHGLYIVRGFYRGVLLPQVATEYKWDTVTFLEETCHKAGLPSHAWKEHDTEIYIFSADLFGENE